jgi:hypothetical protein
MNTVTVDAYKTRKGVEFKKGDEVSFTTGTHRSAQTQRFTIDRFVVRDITLMGKKTGETVTVYGVCTSPSPGVAWGGCSIEEIKLVRRGS